MRFKIASIIIFIITLSGCAATPSPIRRLNSSDASLAEASYNVSRSIVSLSETAQAASPCAKLDPQPNPASYCMAFPTSVDWSGPVEPLVREIAKTTDYRLRVLGCRPAIPVLVSVYAKNTMIGDILRDVGYQCGRRACITIFPDSRVIELRYASN